MSDDSNVFVMPTNPSDLAYLKSQIIDASNIKTMIEAKNDTLKEKRKDVKQKLSIPTPIFNKMVDAYHRQNYHEVSKTNEDFETLYENVMNSGTVNVVNDASDDGDSD